MQLQRPPVQLFSADLARRIRRAPLPPTAVLSPLSTATAAFAALPLQAQLTAQLAALGATTAVSLGAVQWASRSQPAVTKLLIEEATAFEKAR